MDVELHNYLLLNSAEIYRYLPLQFAARPGTGTGTARPGTLATSAFQQPTAGSLAAEQPRMFIIDEKHYY